MEFPASRRDRLVMGLSIGALILFVANIATFVKQHFFDNQAQTEHAFVISEGNESGVIHFEGLVGKHAWRIRHLDDGNAVWAVNSDDLDCELERLEREMAELEESLGMEEAEHAISHLQVYANGQTRHRFEIKAQEMAERMTRRRRGARRHQFGSVELHEHAQDQTSEQTVHVDESVAENGRKSYRIVVRSADGSN